MITSQLLPDHVLGPPPSGGAKPSLGVGPVGSCPSRPSLLIAISDDSGSVTAPGGSDPIANRYVEMNRAFTAVADDCSCGRELAAILHFDSPLGDSGPHLLDQPGLQQLRQGLQVPTGNHGSSSLLPVLTVATDLANRHTSSDVVLMVFSDFALADPDPTSAFAALGAFPGTVYACVLGQSPYAAVPGADQTIALGLARRAGDVSRVLLAGLTAHRGSGPPAGSAPGSGPRNRQPRPGLYGRLQQLNNLKRKEHSS